MRKIDRTKVRAAFDRGAGYYEDTVVVQKRVIERIVAQLRESLPGYQPKAILDVGAGTGILLRSIRGIYPGALMAGLDLAPGMGRIAMSSQQGKEGAFHVEGDAEKIPFADDSFDLVLSTSTFQWLTTLEQAFGEVFRVTASGGVFKFALFGSDTLWELRSSYQAAVTSMGRPLEDRTHSFFSLNQVNDALSQAGFSKYFTESRVEMEYHHDVMRLLRSLKRIGAGNASSSVERGFAEMPVIKSMMEIYQSEHGGAKGIPATYEVVYGQAIKL